MGDCNPLYSPSVLNKFQEMVYRVNSVGCDFCECHSEHLVLCSSSKIQISDKFQIVKIEIPKGEHKLIFILSRTIPVFGF